ncbi:MAG: riboflavin synthase [Bacteroidales bacterium]|nr:riboflavin synthase [Bacteroidales bacterium]
MFTGIIEEIGKIKSIVRHANSIKLTVAANKIMSDMHIGDSISTNGICLTVTTFNSDSFTVDVMPETMMMTNFKNLNVNDLVNLERALPANGRLGGHIVSGHIDGIGTIIRKYNDDKAIRMSFSTTPSILELIIKKGSIAIDGISLTVTDVDSTSFSVSIIEHTQGETTLTSKKIGETVNLENDVIGKYIQKIFASKQSDMSDNNINKGISLDFLESNGF